MALNIPMKYVSMFKHSKLGLVIKQHSDEEARKMLSIVREKLLTLKC